MAGRVVSWVALLSCLVVATPSLADYDLALAAFEAALKQGDVRAALPLGEMYAMGQGTYEKTQKACELYLTAAEIEDPEGLLGTEIEAG
tara:strand:+ start:280 stop:546 length:267 start_codon:yes stop_codon:yes gene_type:complete